MKIYTFYFMALFFAVSIISCSDNPKESDNANKDLTVDKQSADERVIVRLDSVSQKIKVLTAGVEFDTAKYKIVIPGNVYPAPDNINIISAPLSGRIIRVNKHEGDFVSKGDILLEIESLEFAEMISDYIKSKAELKYRENIIERLTNLTQKKISPEAEFELAKSELLRAKASLQSTFSRLIAVGLSENELKQFENQDYPKPHLKIKADISGKINEHNVELGKSVLMYDKLMTIINNDMTLIKGFVSSQDYESISTNTKVTITRNDNPDIKIISTVKSINPALDETTKSLTINILAKSLNDWPKPGQIVRIEVDAASSTKVIFLPSAALMLEGSKNIVFVKIDEYSFEKRIVEVLKSNEQIAIIKSGLNENETVAVTELFYLKAMSKIEEFAD